MAPDLDTPHKPNIWSTTTESGRRKRDLLENLKEQMNLDARHRYNTLSLVRRGYLKPESSDEGGCQIVNIVNKARKTNIRLKTKKKKDSLFHLQRIWNQEKVAA
jgi:hypothetical protein